MNTAPRPPSLAVSTFFVEQARYAQHDMLLLLGMTVGTLALFRVADGESPRSGWIGLSAAALALGVLAKGPVALALPAFMVAVDTLFNRALFRLWGWLLLTGLLALIPPLTIPVGTNEMDQRGIVFPFFERLRDFKRGFQQLPKFNIHVSSSIENIRLYRKSGDSHFYQ